MFIISPKGEGYNCRTNRSSGDGLWSNVVSQRDWVLGHISDNIVGEYVAVLLLAGWFGWLRNITGKLVISLAYNSSAYVYRAS